jgi:hypothetical protein
MCTRSTAVDLKIKESSRKRARVVNFKESDDEFKTPLPVARIDNSTAKFLKLYIQLLSKVVNSKHFMSAEQENRISHNFLKKLSLAPVF